MDQSHRCVVWWRFLCKHIRHSPQSTRLKHNAEVVLWGDKKKNNVCNANKVTSKPVLLAFLICRGFLIFWALFIAFPAATPGESIRHAYRTKWYHWWWWRMRREEQLFRHQRVHLIDRVTFCGRRETGGIMSDLWLKKRFQMHLLHCIIKDESGVGCVCVCVCVPLLLICIFWFILSWICHEMQVLFKSNELLSSLELWICGKCNSTDISICIYTASLVFYWNEVGKWALLRVDIKSVHRAVKTAGFCYVTWSLT